jgi:dUTP pyrophosphatase
MTLIGKDYSKTKVKVINKSKHPLPKYETEHASGMDLKADLVQDIYINVGQRHLISTGLFIEVPIGYEAQIRPRSGLAFKKGLTVLNTPGTIDADYRGELKVLLINLGSEDVSIIDGDRIAQLVISPILSVEFREVTELDSTDRGTGGFGSTGK